MTSTILVQTSLTVRKGITSPMKLAKTNPTITRRIEVAAFFPAIPNTNPSASRSTIPMIPAMVPGMTKLKMIPFPHRSGTPRLGAKSWEAHQDNYDVFDTRSKDGIGVQLKLMIG